MSDENGLEVTRAVREMISREHGNDPRRLVEYYIKYQAKFADRLRRAPAVGREPEEASEHPDDAADAAPARR